MKILIEIPEFEIPKQQDIIEIPLHFVDGKVCEAGGYGFNVLPKGHGDLIDRNEILDWSYQIETMFCIYNEVVNVDDIKSAFIIVEADAESRGV